MITMDQPTIEARNRDMPDESVAWCSISARTPMRTMLILLLLLAAPARADQIGLDAPAAKVEIRTYGIGLIPFDGHFTRFHGVLRYDPAKPDACQVVLDIDAASLVMSNDAVRDVITGPEFMDVAKLPNLSFNGFCHGDVIEGNLLLHGQTHSFRLELDRTVRTVTATGRLQRAEWGMTARRFTAGSTIRIRVEMPNWASGTRG
jgi:polyisoprenoid-binding protein YceI